MKDLGAKIIGGVFLAIVLVIVFVKAGGPGKPSGAAQTATILNAAGSNASTMIKALEG